MELKIIVNSIERKHVYGKIYSYIIEGESFASKVSLYISDDQYVALNEEIGPIQIGSEIPVSIPGDEVDYDE